MPMAISISTKNHPHIHLMLYIIVLNLLTSQLCHCHNNSLAASCIETERVALLTLKSTISDEHGLLSSWKGQDCCRWRGVGCNVSTGHVVKLDLHYPYPYDVEYSDPRRPNKSEVSPSLLHLKDLRYLDLSMNYFDGATIPSFIGSLAKLEYLNLSNAGFRGTIPPQLGNLSSLQFLDLTSDNQYTLAVNKLNWVSRMSSLKHLDMSFVDLSNADDWLHVLNMIPSLSVLRLYISRLPGIPTTLQHINFTSLTVLDLSENNPVSTNPNWTIPNWPFELKGLVNLNLGSNGFYGEIPVSLGDLTNLQVLDLSSNSLSGSIPVEAIRTLRSLRYLDISSNTISGEIPGAIGNLASLQFMNLGSNMLSGKIPDTLGNLSSLKSLYLGTNSISGVIPESLGNLRSLQNLYLSTNNLSGEIPESLGNLRNLVIVELSNNMIGGTIPQSIGSLSSLWALYLSNNNIRGEIPKTIGGLNGLHRLYLSNNKIGGKIPTSIGKLYHIEELLLDNNNINGEIPRAMGNLCNLTTLNASENGIREGMSGFIDSLSRCSPMGLRYLYMGNNNLTGALPDSIGRIQSLNVLDLSSNSLNGSVPGSIGQLSSLTELYLSSNLFVGELVEAHFANLASLITLDLSYNSLSVNVDEEWLPPFKASTIKMSSCFLGPKFPTWLRNQTNLGQLELSGARISEGFPDWFWDLCLSDLILNLSRNQMKGKLPSSMDDCFFIVRLDLSSNHFEGLIPELDPMLDFLDLSNNSFSGPIPTALAGGVDYLWILLLSHNKLNGSIPSSICEANHLEVLDLSYNELSGNLPDCWDNSSVLGIIDFSSNKFSGRIPSSMGQLTLLQSLHLRNNSLSGEIPLPLKNCRQMVTLDLGDNSLSGSMPKWIGASLPSLKVLRLRSNMISGGIPVDLSLLSSLQVLDLGVNNLSGILPPSLGKLTAMISTIQNVNRSDTLGNAGSYYEENLFIHAKGLVLEYTNVLSLVTSIDFSSNGLSGEIPKELMNLHGLVFLNLSENNLTGEIPENIGAMDDLESLDLSINNLSGRIPSSISALHYLGHLNLSHNNFSGRIPSGAQIQTFIDPSIYSSNVGLCGPPLPKKCPHDESSPYREGKGEGEDEGGDASETIWLYISIVLGFVVGFWGFIGAIMIQRSRRIAYFQYIDRITCSGTSR